VSIFASSLFATVNKLVKEIFDRKRVVSSAYITNLIIFDELIRSLMYRVNNRGPNKDPWGTPEVTGARKDEVLLELTYWYLLCK
jgi:hypothetical protein